MKPLWLCTLAPLVPEPPSLFAANHVPSPHIITGTTTLSGVELIARTIHGDKCFMSCRCCAPSRASLDPADAGQPASTAARHDDDGDDDGDDDDLSCCILYIVYCMVGIRFQVVDRW
ncbi:hypothetical protein GQ44DRAFT_310920 [Phaeosphaeriaceae sp. PMI808]|nr:hypothetical protein GQ44DRAFT_310920 [Phaeosphaeriaceae sp. PMI808]